jgi:alpha-beta hydrolase superfamily lysophospholipase
MKTEKVTMVTEDGVTLVGSLSLPEGQPRGAALLLHMMPATKESWQGLAEALADRGVASLAIDLRGHGESVRASGGRTLDYRQFTDADHQAALLDVEAGVAFLRSSLPGGVADRYALVGASIGANLSLRQASSYRDEGVAVAALSPGLDYRGVTTADAVQSMSASQALWIGASRDDQHGSWEALHELAKLRPADLFTAETAGHGTDMFRARPELVAELADWLVTKLS